MEGSNLTGVWCPCELFNNLYSASKCINTLTLIWNDTIFMGQDL